ncbi:MAG: hypothetical protein WCV91_01645 [Candidatus Margulisiibacteriota bacterium]
MKLIKISLIVVIIISAILIGYYFVNKNQATPGTMIEEKITVINNTPDEIKFVSCRATAKGTIETTTIFGPILSNKNSTGFLKVSYPNGIFTVEATQFIKGKEVTASPFTAHMKKEAPLTPVTLTLGTIPWGKDQVKAVWQKVEWDLP